MNNNGTTISGVAERVNERGIKLNGEWFNVSKFKPVELPPEGSQVVTVIDAKGFLSSIQVVEQPQHTPATASLSRNETITRLAVLKAAAQFGASRPDCKSSDVLLLADKWLEWVERAP